MRWAFAAVSVGLVLLSAASLVLGEPLWALVGLVLSVGAVMEFVLPKISLRADTVLIRKAVRSRSIDLRIIERVDVGPFAAHFTLTDGSQVHTSVLQTGLIYRWLGKESGADRFARRITERARSRRDGPKDGL